MNFFFSFNKPECLNFVLNSRVNIFLSIYRRTMNWTNGSHSCHFSRPTTKALRIGLFIHLLTHPSLSPSPPPFCKHLLHKYSNGPLSKWVRGTSMAAFILTLPCGVWPRSLLQRLPLKHMFQLRQYLFAHDSQLGPPWSCLPTGIQSGIYNPLRDVSPRWRLDLNAASVLNCHNGASGYGYYYDNISFYISS